jgi:hypothetical protein
MEKIIDDFTALCLSENSTPPTLNVEKKGDYTITTTNLNYSNHKMLTFTDAQFTKWNGGFIHTGGYIYKRYTLV